MSFCRCSSRACYHSSWRGKDQDHARKGIHTLNTATQHNASSGSEFINTAVRWCLAGGELSDPRSGREHVLTVSACRTGAGRGSAGTLVTPVHIYHLTWNMDHFGNTLFVRMVSVKSADMLLLQENFHPKAACHWEVKQRPIVPPVNSPTMSVFQGVPPKILVFCESSSSSLSKPPFFSSGSL